MASRKSDVRQSLAVLPKNYVIMAKRVSQGGELILMEKHSEVSVECEHYTKKGRACVLGPLGELIKIKGVKIRRADCSKADTGSSTSTITKPEKREVPCKYNQFKLDIKGLQPKPAAEEPKQKEESGDAEPAKVKDTKGLQIQSDSEIKGLRISALQQKGRFNNVLQVPLHTISQYSVHVRWKQHPNIPCYTMKTVYDVLSRYGNIIAMGQLSMNSCLVLFESFTVAVLVVRDSLIGPKAYPLICMWYYPLMYMDSIDLLDIHPYKKTKIISEEAKWLHRFRDMQEQILTCFKGRGAALCHDRATFNP